MTHFSLILKQLRKSINLTQEELSLKLNISRSRLANYEQNKREPNLTQLQAIADFFNVELDYLLGRATTTKINEITILIDKDLTKEEIKEVEDYIKFLKSKRK